MYGLSSDGDVQIVMTVGFLFCYSRGYHLAVALWSRVSVTRDGTACVILMLYHVYRLDKNVDWIRDTEMVKR